MDVDCAIRHDKKQRSHNLDDVVHCSADENSYSEAFVDGSNRLQLEVCANKNV